MSLRDLGIFSPLPPDHPSVGERCWLCQQPINAGYRTTLMAVETPEEVNAREGRADKFVNIRAEIVHADCAWRGRELMTPLGPRVVEHILSEPDSQYAVIMTDGFKWTEEEVGKIVVDSE